jgi:hypothetical protein
MALTLTHAEREQLIERYAAGPARLRAALERVPPEARQQRPAPGGWSPHEIVCHCADSETCAAVRIRYLLAERQPRIDGYDQDEWARGFDYHAQPLELALATIDALRAQTTFLLRRLPEAAWDHEGTHSQHGRYTAEDWLRIYAAHLEGHAGQIERALAAWGAAEQGE